MELPTLEIAPGEPLLQAVARLDRECQKSGIQLVGFENLNSTLPFSRSSNFFQARIGGVETVFLVMTDEWNNANLVRILNILLEIRADPDPPGSKLRFKIYSAHPVPVLLKTLFGDYRISSVECEAAMVARFASELSAGDCPRLAAAALHFLRSLGRETDFRDPKGIATISEAVWVEVHELGLPPEGTPLNFLICVGCLYGELLRSMLAYPSEWIMVKEYLPWPCLAVRPISDPGASLGSPALHHLGFSPIALVIQLSQGGDPQLLEKSASMLEERSRKEFGTPAAGRIG